MSESPADQSDADLMRLAQSGQPEPFAELVCRYWFPLLRTAQSRFPGDDVAADLVQETFLAAFKSRHTYKRRYSVRTWLWTILLNQCRSHAGRRARNGRIAVWSDIHDSGIEAAVYRASLDRGRRSPAAELMAKERAERLRSLLDRLRPQQADAVRLRFFGGLKFQEIADAMRCSLATAKNRVKVGLLRLSSIVDQDDGPLRAEGQAARASARPDCETSSGER